MKRYFWNPEQTVAYNVTKLASIIIGDLFYILDVYIGYLLGTENFCLAFILIPVAICIGITNNLAWSWVLEEIGLYKIKQGRKLARKKKNGGK
jgi:hypothetical protein